ncbi:MAG: beta-glucanase (GH16 family) [Psychromonas sp.]|jgi:beta-glucanase (GH16 family)
MTSLFQQIYLCISHPIQRSLTTLLAALLMLSFSSLTMAGWEVKWIDKFDGTGVNWDNWTAQTQANYNNEVQCYTNDDSTADKNYDVSGGTLKIIARKQNISCPGLNGAQKSWTSGRLNSKDKNEFLNGRIESRIRFHNLESGTWPAFWMLENRIAEQPVAYDGDDVTWPNAGAGEIDIWEWSSNAPDYYITNFFNEVARNSGNKTACGNKVLHNYPSDSADVQNWHNYAMEWNANRISFYIDDTLVVSQDMSSCSQYEEPMFVLLNVAMGGELGGTIDSSLTQATMEVDYVAHCQASDANNATYCNEELANQDNSLLGVSINITQNGQTITDINPNDGSVTLNAKPSNTVTGNSYSYEWQTDRLPSPITTGQQVNFDPSSMDDGYYYVSVTITDEQNSALTKREYVVLEVSSPNTPSSGGSVNQLLLGCLVLLCIFRRRFNLV